MIRRTAYIINTVLLYVLAFIAKQVCGLAFLGLVTHCLTWYRHLSYLVTFGTSQALSTKTIHSWACLIGNSSDFFSGIRFLRRCCVVLLKCSHWELPFGWYAVVWDFEILYMEQVSFTMALSNFPHLLFFFIKITCWNFHSRKPSLCKNSLDPGQAQTFVGPDLSQNCMQRL